MLIVAAQDGQVLLERRPPNGVWGGLYAFPEVREDVQAERWCLNVVNNEPLHVHTLPELVHTFSHFRLRIRPELVVLRATGSSRTATAVMEDTSRLWYKLNDPANVGLAAPVRKLLVTTQAMLELEEKILDESNGQLRIVG